MAVPAIDRATLMNWLVEARAAHHELMLGTRVVMLRHGLKTIQFGKSDAPRLKSYIVELEAQLQDEPSRGAIGIVF